MRAINSSLISSKYETYSEVERHNRQTYRVTWKDGLPDFQTQRDGMHRKHHLNYIEVLGKKVMSTL
jgi:hypothetical protein